MSKTKRRKSIRLADPNLNDLGAPVEVRRHPKARRLTMRVSRTKRAVVVTMPLQCDLREAGQFIDRNLDWLRERIGSIPKAVPFRDGVLMPLRGRPHEIIFAGCRSAGAGSVEYKGEIENQPQLVVYGRKEHAARRLRDWCFEEARRDLDARVRSHAQKLKLKPKRVAVRDQSSRWGSCSTTGTLSFSWRLVMAPPFVLDYVAAHEVAHLAEMNHGPRFWNLVKKTMPQMEEAKQWLKTYGMDLHRYGIE